MKKSAWLFLSVSAMAACQGKTDAAPQKVATEPLAATSTAAASAANNADYKREAVDLAIAAPTTTPPVAPDQNAAKAGQPADPGLATTDQQPPTTLPRKALAKPSPALAPVPQEGTLNPYGGPAGGSVGGNVGTVGHGVSGEGRFRAATPVPPPPSRAGFGSGGLGIVAADKPVEQAAPVPVVDRNARYATTYRPGGAALAAFDAAVSKGSIPTTYKDLVQDFGGRYAPSLTVPAGSAMAFSVEGDRGMLSPSGGLVNLRISMRSSDAMPTRAPLSVHLVLDISGSMQGLAIENA
jgi:hypothetical protein